MVCDLRLVDLDPFCFVVIMIDGSEKRNCEGGFWTFNRVRMFVKKRNNAELHAKSLVYRYIFLQIGYISS